MNLRRFASQVGGKWLDLAAVERSLQDAGCQEVCFLWDEVAKLRHAAVVLGDAAPLAAAAAQLQAQERTHFEMLDRI